ncbi:MAG: hypothetical protein WDM96_00395 [Lacunisphaera sp.]
MIAIALYHRGGAAGLALPLAADGTPDYNMVVPAMLAKYFPNGMLGIGLTALMASFMSGMAGNVTAFNTVWTYDLYQRWFKPDASDAQLITVGRITTVVGLLISAVCAYAAAKFNNIMDLLQLVFGFVNAPLFAIFLLGMFWRRATGHGAFFGLLAGTVIAALFHGSTLPAGETAGIFKGGWISVQHTFASSMAQSFWMAIFAFTGCFLGTFLISLATKPNRTDDELRGLVYSLTERQRDGDDLPWYARPSALGAIVLVAALILNIVFW